ncbi:MAG: beta-glucosidase family protein [Spirochaetota bacterium]
MNAISRAAAILAGMTLDEKLAVMSGIDNMYTKGVPRLGVRRIRMADASMGLRDDEIDATAFPAFIGLAATWNRERALAYGEAVGEEFRAADIDVVLGPGVNLYRVHECGRNFEYLGEDPVLAATMVVPYIRGVQSRGVAATVKHFVANNTDWHRCVSNSIVDERTLRELYFVPFEAAVKDGGVRCLMTSYNLVGGEYAGENRWLLTDVLLGDWEFDGLVMSDWMGLWNPAPSIASGLHLEMPAAKAFDPAVIRTMIEEGVVSEADIDARVRRVLELTARLEEMQLEVPNRRLSRNEEHAGVALEVAREGIVLLKNADGLLPLDASEGSIGVIGPHGDPTPTSGGGAAAVRAIDPVSIAEGIFAVAPDRTLLRAGDGRDEARVLADADVAVVCVGYTGEREREGCDRPWELPASDVDLIKRASRVAKRTVVVVVAGGGVEMTSWVDDVDAILHIWYPGEIGARALAEILFGEVSPSGKLPISIERVHGDRSSVANYLPEGAELYETPDFVSQDAAPYDVTYAEGVFAGYRHLDALAIEPLFAFGFGLSYTSFSYTELSVEERGDRLAVMFRVTNDGERDGMETAQVYARPPESLADALPRRLVGFTKQNVHAAETVAYVVDVPIRALASWDTSQRAWQLPGGTWTLEVGASSRDVRLSHRIELGARRISVKENVL